MSREMLCKIYLDTRALVAVMSKGSDHRTQVLMVADDENKILGNGYVHFEKESGDVRVSEKGRVAINVRKKGEKDLLCRVHVSLASLKAALSKDASDEDKRAQVLMYALPGGEIAGNGYISFDRETGKARFSSRGKVHINVRSTKTWAETASQELDKVLPAQAASEPTSELPLGITDEDIDALVEAELAK